MYAIVKCLVVLAAAVAAHGFNLGPADVSFHVFNRVTPQLSEPLLPNVNSIMGSTAFSPNRPTVMTIHSYNDSVGGNFNAFMIPEHLAAADVNVVAVDWSVAAEMYTNALGNAPQVGEVIAEFINILTDIAGYGPSNFRVVGVGLGAHIAGIAARRVSGTVARIVAIDPSFTGWTHHPEILRASDAASVEVLHATAGIVGYDYPLGDLDFYPNGGASQPGCASDVSCSRTYGYAFYAESIRADIEDGTKFVATACESYEQARAQQCAGDRDVHFGGTDDKTGATGIYWFETNIAPPFARG